LTGSIKGIEDGKLLFESASFGPVKIPSEDIKAVSTDDIVTVEFKEGGYATGQLSTVDDGTILLSGPKETTSKFDYAAVKAIYPGGEIPAPEFEWTARVNVGASKSSGNTDNEAYNIDAEALGRGEKDRITLLAEFNRESSQGNKTADDQRLVGQYDRFISKTWFLYLQGSAERDDFQDLNLRTTIGPGAGYQIIDTELTNLLVEAGPTYVNEDFDLAKDREFITGRWALKFDTFVFEKFAQLFHNQEGLVNLEDTSDVLIRTRQGARIPLRNNLNVAAQVNLDHDTKPAAGRDKTDTKYILSVGYNF
jgi:putative salt-induced outer membrane protein YdiY